MVWPVLAHSTNTGFVFYALYWIPSLAEAVYLQPNAYNGIFWQIIADQPVVRLLQP